MKKKKIDDDDDVMPFFLKKEKRKRRLSEKGSDFGSSLQSFLSSFPIFFSSISLLK